MRRPAAHQSPSAREQVYVASEFSANQNVKDSLANSGGANQFDPPTKDDEDAVTQIPPFQDDLTCLCIRLPPKRGKLSNLRCIQLGKPRLDLFG
jgi:hypothetical protein